MVGMKRARLALACVSILTALGAPAGHLAAQDNAAAYGLQKDPTEYALWRIPTGPVPQGARFVVLELSAPEGTQLSFWVREGGPGGEAFLLGYGYVTFSREGQRCVLPLDFAPLKRGWMPRRNEDRLVFPPAECPDRGIPWGEVRLALGDGRLSLERVDSIELEFPASLGWTGPARQEQYTVRGLRFLERSPREELLQTAGVVRVRADLGQRLGAVNPLWKDACHSSKSFAQLGQRMYKVFGAATFGPSYPPQDGPNGAYHWWAVDGQMRAAQAAAPVIQVVMGRDVPPWLWQPGAEAQQALLAPWKPGQLLPPTDLGAYEEIVYRLARHIRQDLKCRVHSYIVWGGADNPGYFRGSIEDYCEVYAACARAIRRADPEAKVGGPSPDPMYSPDWVRGLITYCGEEGVPLDFVSLHSYSLYPDQSRQAAVYTRGLLQPYPALRGAAIHFDEWNSAFGLGKLIADFKRSAMNAAYAAATFGELTAGGVAYACYAAPGEGFGLFQTRLEEDDGTPRPIYNSFRLFGRLTGDRCAAAVQPAGSGIGALAACDGATARVALWGYAAEHGPFAPPLVTPVEVTLSGLAGPDGVRAVRVWCVDGTHSNLAAGKEHANLEALPPMQAEVRGGRATVRLTVEIPSVLLVEVVSA